MRDFKKRRAQGKDVLRVMVGSAGVLLLAGVAFFALRGAWNMYGKFVSASDARQSAESQLASLEGRYATVKADVDSLQSERGIEAEVRERYGVARPGEGQIDIVRQASTTEEVVLKKQTLFERLWDLLFVW